MLIRDPSGLELTGASQAAADKYAAALNAWHRYAGDPMTLLAEATLESPQFVMAHALTAYLCLLGTNAEARAAGVDSIRAAADLPASPWERAHIAALRAIAAGDMRKSARILEDVLVEVPRDVIALQAGQTLDFFLGDSRMLRDRIGRTLPHWSRSDPAWHAVLGMLAFGLEETGHYGRAEEAGRESLELDRRNSWAQHAVAHVMEMQDRRADGVAFMRADIDAWTHENFFQVHNWWHLGLFHLGLGEVDEVLRLFDGPIFGPRSDMALDMVDAAAMLWRLHLLDIDLGDRMTALSEHYEAKGSPGVYAFDDVHAMMAHVGAGRREAQAEIRKVQQRAGEGQGDNAYFAREVGLPMIEALAAFGDGDFRTTLERLRPVRNIANRFGGSHAQRDLIDLTMIEAARRGGMERMHSALLAERETAKPRVEGEAARRVA